MDIARVQKNAGANQGETIMLTQVNPKMRKMFDAIDSICSLNSPTRYAKSIRRIGENALVIDPETSAG
jgi:hypothetical protein